MNAKPVLLRWWDYFFTPSNEAQESGSDFQVNEYVSQGRKVSFIIALMFLGTLAGFLDEPQLGRQVIVVIVLLLDIVALILNKMGKPFWASLLLIFATQGGLLTNVFFSFLRAEPFVTFVSLVVSLQTELVAVSLLPPWTVFFFIVINGLIDIVFIATGYIPKTAGGPILVLAIQIGCLLYVWVQYERSMRITANQLDAKASWYSSRSTSLSNGVAFLQQVIAEVADDPMKAIPVPASSNLRWTQLILTALNQLRLRAVRNQQDERIHQQTLQALQRYEELLTHPKWFLVLFSWQPTGTSVDALVEQLQRRLVEGDLVTIKKQEE